MNTYLKLKRAGVKKFFYEASKNIKILETNNAWEKTIKENSQNLELKKEDIEIIKDLGIKLGKTDVDGQISQLQLFNNLLKTQIAKAEDESKKNEKMYKSLGTIIGLAIVIILI